MRNRQPSAPPTLLSVALLAAAIAAVGSLVLLLTSRPATPGGSSAQIQVTLFAVTPAALLAPAEAATPTPEAAPTPLPSPTPRVTQYVVQPNDTLWDIAIRFGLTTLDPLIAVNHGINPDFLSVGQVLNIPGADFVPPVRTVATPSDGLSPTAPAQPSAGDYMIGSVLPDAGGLRLRSGPSYDSSVITRLGPNTELRIYGPIAGQSWLRVMTPNGTMGYVDARYVSVGSAATLPGAGIEAVPTAVTGGEGPLEYPYLSDISPRMVEIFRIGQAMGNRANVIAVVGDSNSQHPAFLKPFDWGNYNLGNYGYLQATIDFFRGSFAKDSPAAVGGFNTIKVLDPAQSPPYCNGEAPLICEYNQKRPSVALILLGTGDQHNWQSFEANYRRIIEVSLSRGVIPVLITKGDDLECRDNNAPCGFINSKIAQLAAEYQAPLLNLRQVTQQLPNGGMTGDGFHYNFPPGDRSAWFTAEYLQYGYNQRNLTALQALDVLRRRVIQASG